MCSGFAGDGAIRMKFEMHPFVSRDLKDDERESKLEHALQCHHAPQCVIVALHRKREEVEDQQYIHNAAQSLRYAPEHRETNRAIESDGVRQAAERTPGNRRLAAVRDARFVSGVIVWNARQRHGAIG